MSRLDRPCHRARLDAVVLSGEGSPHSDPEVRTRVSGWVLTSRPRACSIPTYALTLLSEHFGGHLVTWHRQNRFPSPSVTVPLLTAPEVCGQTPPRGPWQARVDRWGALASGAAFALVMLCLYNFAAPFEFDSDEGVNVMKALLLAHGHALYSEVWNDQPPLLSWFLRCRGSVSGDGTLRPGVCWCCCSRRRRCSRCTTSCASLGGTALRSPRWRSSVRAATSSISAWPSWLGFRRLRGASWCLGAVSLVPPREHEVAHAGRRAVRTVPHDQALHGADSALAGTLGSSWKDGVARTTVSGAAYGRSAFFSRWRLW